MSGFFEQIKWTIIIAVFSVVDFIRENPKRVIASAVAAIIALALACTLCGCSEVTEATVNHANDSTAKATADLAVARATAPGAERDALLLKAYEEIAQAKAENKALVAQAGAERDIANGAASTTSAVGLAGGALTIGLSILGMYLKNRGDFYSRAANTGAANIEHLKELVPDDEYDAAMKVVQDHQTAHGVKKFFADAADKFKSSALAETAAVVSAVVSDPPIEVKA
jgi:hypothetical protein